MADLSNLDAAQTIKIAGANSSGIESTFVDATANNELKTADTLDNGGVNGAITVTTSPIEAKVGASVLPDRKMLTVYNNGNKTIYWGFDSSVSASNGTPIEKSQFFAWSVGQNTLIYLIADSGSQNVRITESA